ncbi:MAG TPA: hypothetical protein VES69_10705, partial [Pyrinomonadaceae bacterium]|nr:hypothetical protein [Pyrinomonadaceae bacterium]
RLTKHLNELEGLTTKDSALPQGDIPSMRGQLLYQQGRFDEALAQVELAWARYNDTGYFKSGFADEAIRYNLKLGQIQSAKHWSELLITQERESQSVMEKRECRLLKRHAQFLFALWDQRYAEADIQVKELEQELEGTQAIGWWSICREFRIRSLLLQSRYGDPLLQSHPARALLTRRSEENKTVHYFYERFRLLIDYRLAALRFALGIEPADDYWYTRKQVLSIKSKITGHSNFQDRIFRVRHSCEKALRQALYLDHCFQCDWRQNEIQRRIERLDEIVAASTG